MRIWISVAIAGAIGVATPALAQNNAVPPANTTATNEAAPNNAMTSTPAGPATPDASLPPTESSPAARGAAPIVAQKTGFPWGVLGLLGLLGIYGAQALELGLPGPTVSFPPRSWLLKPDERQQQTNFNRHRGRRTAQGMAPPPRQCARRARIDHPVRQRRGAREQRPRAWDLSLRPAGHRDALGAVGGVDRA